MLWILGLLLLMATASAETAMMDNYSITFNISEPHKTELQEYSVNVKTFEGFTAIYPYVTLNDIEERNLVFVGEVEDGYLYVEGSAPALVAKYDDKTVISNLPLLDFLDFLKTIEVREVAPLPLSPS